jgi:hypothetical protein
MAGEPPRLTYGDLSPVEALALLGDDVRAEILWTLAEARGGEGNPPALPFSELRRRVDASVDSSRLNYHLQQLVGRFVEHRGSDGAHPINAFTARQENFATRGEGYALRPEGHLLTQVVRAGTTRGDPDVQPFGIGVDCHHCGTEIEAAYLGWIAALQCPDCDHLYEYNATPPGIVATDDDFLSRASAYNRHQRRAAARGVCTQCGNGLGHRFIDPAEVNYPRGERREAMIEFNCSHCGNMDYLTAGEFLLGEPALISFCHERGEDLTSVPIWELPFASTDLHTTVHSRDPWAVEVAVSRAGETLRLTIDESLTVEAELDS